jgi:hypothetical protein
VFGTYPIKPKPTHVINHMSKSEIKYSVGFSLIRYVQITLYRLDNLNSRSPNNSNLIAVITLIGLIYLPSKLKLFGQIPGSSGMDREVEDENTQILRQMGNFRRRKTGNPKNKHV